MRIRYEWKDVEVNVPNGYGELPHNHREIRDIEYDYNIDIKIRDVVQYLMPYNLVNKQDKTQEDVNEIKLANFYLTKATNYLVDQLGIDLEDLENDEFFVEYMHQRYEKDAWEEYQNGNDSY